MITGQSVVLSIRDLEKTYRSAGEDVAIKQGAQVDLAIDADQKDTIKKEK